MFECQLNCNPVISGLYLCCVLQASMLLLWVVIYTAVRVKGPMAVFGLLERVWRGLHNSEWIMCYSWFWSQLSKSFKFSTFSSAHLVYHRDSHRKNVLHINQIFTGIFMVCYFLTWLVLLDRFLSVKLSHPHLFLAHTQSQRKPIKWSTFIVNQCLYSPGDPSQKMTVADYELD